MKKILVFVVVIVVSCGAGAFGGFLWASRAFSRFEISKEIEVAAQAAMAANTLAMLRLNNTNTAIEHLETQMDGALTTIVSWDEYVRFKPDEKTRTARDRWLTSVKIYHQSYPFKDEDTNLVELVNKFLDKIPGRNPKSTCKSDLCRMDDLRLAGSTNLPTTYFLPK
jgi:hypothetical protein